MDLAFTMAKALQPRDQRPNAPIAKQLPITELVREDRRNTPCAIPQLCCITQALLPGLAFPILKGIADKNFDQKGLTNLLHIACSG